MLRAFPSASHITHQSNSKEWTLEESSYHLTKPNTRKELLVRVSIKNHCRLVSNIPYSTHLKALFYHLLGLCTSFNSDI